MYLPANEDTGGISLGPFFVVGDFAGKRIVLDTISFYSFVYRCSLES
jgi:hypothetical protein